MTNRSNFFALGLFLVLPFATALGAPANGSSSVNRSNLYLGLGSSLVSDPSLGLSAGYAYPVGRFALDARLKVFSTTYAAIAAKPSEKEMLYYPSGAYEQPDSEYHRQRGSGDSWSGRQVSLGFSLTEPWSRANESRWLRSMRVAVGRQMLHDGVNSLDFSGWFFSVEASVPYRFPKSRWFLVPALEGRWGSVHRSDLPHSEETRLSTRELEATVRLGFWL